MDSMWKFSPEESNEETPKAVLEQQAEHLPALTNDLVYASVAEKDWTIYPIAGLDFKGDFVYSFNLKSKFLSHYSFEILAVSHNVPIYPVKLVLDSEIQKELNLEASKGYITVGTEAEFKDLLSNILGSKRIGTVINSIMKLSK